MQQYNLVFLIEAVQTINSTGDLGYSNEIILIYKERITLGCCLTENDTWNSSCFQRRS